MTLKVTDGLEVPLHRSLVEPMMVVGLPRTVALVLWTTVSRRSGGWTRRPARFSRVSPIRPTPSLPEESSHDELA